MKIHHELFEDESFVPALMARESEDWGEEELDFDHDDEVEFIDIIDAE